MTIAGGARPLLCSALWLPIFDEFTDPLRVARLAAEAEEAGWHGFFVWDHLSWPAPVRQVADPWITLDLRFAEAWRGFAAAAEGWVEVVSQHGPEALRQVWLEVLAGRSAPRVG